MSVGLTPQKGRDLDPVILQALFGLMLLQVLRRLHRRVAARSGPLIGMAGHPSDQ